MSGSDFFNLGILTQTLSYHTTPGDSSCETTVTESGIDLSQVPLNEESKKLLEVAQRTGMSLVLSEDDVLAEVVEQTELEKCLQVNRAEIAICIQDTLNTGTSFRLQNYSKNAQAATKKRADRFLKDAKTLLTRFKIEVKTTRQSYSVPVLCPAVDQGSKVEVKTIEQSYPLPVPYPWVDQGSKESSRGENRGCH